MIRDVITAASRGAMGIRRLIASLCAAALSASALVFMVTPVEAGNVVPKKGDCLLLEKDRAWLPQATFTIVPCGRSHNSDVFKVIPYPEDLGAPSTIAEQRHDLFDKSCTYKELQSWLGTTKYKVPVNVYRVFRLPTDQQWKAGARWVVCAVVHEGPNGSATSYKGALPALLASTPLIRWVACATETPRSGAQTAYGPCTKKSEWLVIGLIGFEAKVTANYPKDAQAEGDKRCAKVATPLLKKGSTTPALAALFPRESLPPDYVLGQCFIALADWTGKAR